MSDLFLDQKKLSAKERLYNYIVDKGFAKTSDVIRWGSENFCNRSDRNARQLAFDKKIRRMSDTEKMFKVPSATKEEVWVIV